MLDLINEAYSPLGAMDARAIREALGRFDISAWEVFLRETVQNSWDARREPTIDFSISASRLSRAQRRWLAEEVLSEAPPTLRDFVASLDHSEVELLTVTDRGTKGLGGPTRADIVADEGEAVDFREFVRNIGRDESRGVEGGTYGFGKSVLYQASSINTCIIYSQTLVSGNVEPRLIAMRLSARYEWDGLNYTGRHWWGRRQGEMYVEPLIGEEATKFADALGILAMGPDETGTTVAVVAPVGLDGNAGSDLRAVVELLAEAATRWAWPHMIGSDFGPTIRFTFEAFGIQIVHIPPSEHPVFRHYAAAYRAAAKGLSVQADSDEFPVTGRAIRQLRPARYLGQLAWKKAIRPELGRKDEAFTGHVALMRDPRLVVKYLQIADDPAALMTTGVFICDPRMDAVFAKSEPPAHDDWKPETLAEDDRQGRANPVRIALNKILDEFRPQPTSEMTPESTESDGSIASIARSLGSILAGASGPGSEGDPGRNGRKLRASDGTGPGAAPARVIMDGTPVLAVDEETGRVVTDFLFTVVVSSGTNPDEFEIEAEPLVVLDGGMTEKAGDRPIGAEVPEVLGWYSGEAKNEHGSSLKLKAALGDDMRVRVSQPPDSSVTVHLNVVKHS